MQRSLSRGLFALGLLAAGLAVPALFRAPAGAAQQAQVVIEINEDATGKAAYATWAPAFCRARVVNGGTADVKVVLSNDPAAVAAADRGEVLFAAHQQPWPKNTTATEQTLTLTLPGNGAWQPFVIAGKFGKPSTNDKDAVIVATDAATGAALGKKPLMVRVRKNANNLTAEERDRFLDVLGKLHFVQNRYKTYQEIHSIGYKEAHGGPAFLAWHRGFLLQLERELQSIDRSVSLPYWKFDEAAPRVFTEDFMGANPGDGEGLESATFSATNSINGWSIDGRPFIQRSGLYDHLGVPPVQRDAATLEPAGYEAFRDMEGDPHAVAHGWVGGWMGDPLKAARDPIFFLLHCNADRLWAKWQWQHVRFGAGVNDYSPSGKFPGPMARGVKRERIGHYLEDTMWPWNGAMGDPNTPDDPLDDRPGTAPGSAFPAVAPFKLGPPRPITPKCMIDYLGRAVPSDGHGYCYDDVPFSP
jgi:tyrosinase